MKIKLIDAATHAELVALFNNHPELRLQNVGYEYLSPAIREAKAAEIKRIEEILKEHVAGFVEFFNFRLDHEQIVLRFDYDWGAADGSHYFTGVGYVGLDELRDGFKKKSQA